MGMQTVSTVLEERMVNTHVLGASDVECHQKDADVVTREEKEYQQLIMEKLKSAAEWDVRDTRLFALR